jgi:P pilus assembly chaperone PapD
MFRGSATVAALLIGCCGPAAAQLTANPAIMSFNGTENTRQDIKIGNTSSRTQYLKISAARILEPGVNPETYFESPDPDEVGLLVAPRRIALQPGEERIVRVILLEDEIETDKAWRVHIQPTIGDIEADRNVAVTLLAFKALVFARPDNPTTEIVGGRDGKTLTLTNVGTSNVVLFNGEQCPGNDEPCQRVTGKRLWPGLEWTTELPADAPVTFELRDTGEDRSIKF